jgi:4-alpha-glucanotransferase
MVPAQDLLGLGNGARMNRPGVARGNWRWRLSPGALDRALAEDLFRLTAATGRAPRRTNRRKDA